MKKILLLFSLVWFHQKLFAQNVENVGINTFYPDPSAALDIKITNKGVLLPQVFLQSTTDGSTIANPAKALLIFNSNNSLFDKSGFYYNASTAVTPVWAKIGGRMKLPYVQTISKPTVLFGLTNTAAASSVVALRGIAAFGTGVFGSGGGYGIMASSLGSGSALLANNYDSNGKALEVFGKLRLHVSYGPGKVLTSDADGNATFQSPVVGNGTGISFSAVGVLGNGNENMSETTFIKVAFENEMYDLGGNYNNASASPHSSFIAPKHGIYHFTSQLCWWDDAQDSDLYGPTLKLVRIRNGITTDLAENRAWEDDLEHISQVSIDCELLPGDIINVVARSYAPQIKLRRGSWIGGNLQCQFSGELVAEL